jgi:hypothetical protein
MNTQMLDYENVRVVLNDNVDLLAEEVQEPDLTFKFSSFTSNLPIIFFYSSTEKDERTEKICEEAGVLTCGAFGSKIPFATPEVFNSFSSLNKEDEKYTAGVFSYLYETLDPSLYKSRYEINQINKCARSAVIGCSISALHVKALANLFDNEFNALLIGPTQASTFKNIDTLGMATPRVSLVQEISKCINAPIFVTAGSATETCKAFVAGADAVVINIGGPFGPDDDVKFVVDAVTQSLKENIQNLCKIARAQKISELSFRCRLEPVK